MRTSKLISAVTFCMLYYTSGIAQNRAYPLQYEKTGQGSESIIFIPGFASSGEVWKETKAEFEKDFTCYALTMPGFAGAQPQPNCTFKNWVLAIIQFINENKIPKPILVGHSMGGGLAMAVAADFPDLVKQIVVVDALPCLAALMNPSFKAMANVDCSASVNQMTSLSGEQFLSMQKMSIPMLLSNADKREMAINWSVKSDRTTLGQMYCDFSNTDLREQIKTIVCPALILLEADFTPIKTSIDSQYDNLKNASLRYATKGKHFIMYDDPDWYMAQLKGFIKPSHP